MLPDPNCTRCKGEGGFAPVFQDDYAMYGGGDVPCWCLQRPGQQYHLTYQEQFSVLAPSPEMQLPIRSTDFKSAIEEFRQTYPDVILKAVKVRMPDGTMRPMTLGDLP